MSAASTSREQHVWQVLSAVPDPEVPVVSVVDLGIVRGVEVEEQQDEVTVTITPTYSGCPALGHIEREIGRVLASEFERVRVRTVLTPAWTTDWMSDDARERLRSAGIAPPGRAPAAPAPGASFQAFATITGPGASDPACPRCDSPDVERISEFGSTACKSLWRCRACGDPFDHFKAI